MLHAMATPSITANVSSEEIITEAKHAAIESKKSLRQWAGAVIEAELCRRRSILKKSPKLKDR